jgi:hypothetical protein
MSLDDIQLQIDAFQLAEDGRETNGMMNVSGSSA